MVGAVDSPEEAAQEVITGAAAVPEEAASPTIITTKISQTTPTVLNKNLIRRVRSMQTYLQTLPGPVPNIGRKVGVLHTVQIPLCVSG